MDVTLTMAVPDLAADDLHDLSLDLCRSLQSDGGIDAEPVAGAAVAATRGEPITLGVLALSFLTSGAAAALLNVVKSYFERSSSMTVELVRPDGAKLTVQAADMGGGRFERTLSLAHQFLQPSQP